VFLYSALNMNISTSCFTRTASKSSLTVCCDHFSNFILHEVPVATVLCIFQSCSCWASVLSYRQTPTFRRYILSTCTFSGQYCPEQQHRRLHSRENLNSHIFNLSQFITAYHFHTVFTNCIVKCLLRRQ
jgi:hypothetical protein